METNKTFFIIKPEVLRNHHTGEVLNRIVEAEFKISKMKRFYAKSDTIKEHYQHLKDKPFFNDILEYMTSGPIIIGILSKENAIEEWRNLMGSTNPLEAEEGTLRKDFGYIEGGNIYNTVHGSDSYESFIKEVGIWYN